MDLSSQSNVVHISKSFTDRDLVKYQRYSSIQSAINDFESSQTNSIQMVVHPGVYVEKIVMKNGIHLHFEQGAIVQYTTPASSTEGVIELRMSSPVTTGMPLARECTNYSITGFGEFYQFGLHVGAKGIYFKDGLAICSPSIDALVGLFMPVIEGNLLVTWGCDALYSAADSTVRFLGKITFRQGIHRRVGMGSTEVTSGITAINLSAATANAFVKLYIRNTPFIRYDVMTNSGGGSASVPTSGQFYVVYVGQSCSLDIEDCLIYQNRTGTGSWRCINYDTGAGLSVTFGNILQNRLSNVRILNSRNTALATPIMTVTSAPPVFENVAISCGASVTNCIGTASEAIIYLRGNTVFSNKDVQAEVTQTGGVTQVDDSYSSVSSN